MKAFNKRGDKGETSLLYGGRVAKSDPRCEAYGTIDEAVSLLGLARALTEKEQVLHILYGIQQDLFIVGSELAIAADEYHKLKAKHQVVTVEMLDRLEGLIEDLELKVEMPKSFVIPGNCPSSAVLDVARAVIRRAERRVVVLKNENLVPNERVLAYLNRLADLIFTLARYDETE
jgi:cob(I)alamin adenosyltransferase